MNFTLIKNEEIKFQSKKLKCKLVNVPWNVYWEPFSCQPEPGAKGRATVKAGFILPSNILEFCISCCSFPKIKLHYSSLYSYMFVGSSSVWWCQALKVSAAFKLIAMGSHPCFFSWQCFSAMKSIFHSWSFIDIDLGKAKEASDAIQRKTTSNILTFL